MYVIVVVPIGNAFPGLKSDVSVTASPELSFAVGGVHDTVAVGKLASVVTFWVDGVPYKTGISISIKNKTFKNILLSD